MAVVPFTGLHPLSTQVSSPVPSVAKPCDCVVNAQLHKVHTLVQRGPISNHPHSQGNSSASPERSLNSWCMPGIQLHAQQEQQHEGQQSRH